MPRPASTLRPRHRRQPPARRQGRRPPTARSSGGRSPGGLVTAMESVMRGREGAWVGWAGDAGEAARAVRRRTTSTCSRSPLSAERGEDHYEGFCNDTLWPIYHDVIVPAPFHRAGGRLPPGQPPLRRGRRRGGRAAAATVWVHDYQLQLVPAMLRKLRPDVRIGWFNHIPFPPVELFAQLPWRAQLLEGLLGADLLGFQRTGRRPRTSCAPAASCSACPPRATRCVHRSDGASTARVRASAFPISVDFTRPGGARRSARRSWQRAEEIRAEPGQPRARAARASTGSTTPRASGTGSRPTRSCSPTARSARRTTVLVQVATPSRERVDAYRELRERGRGDRRPDQRRATARSARPPCTTCTTRYPREEMAALFLAGRRHAGHAAARRHEPGRQGVRHVPPRPGRRAGALASSPAPATSCDQAFVVQPARHRRPQAHDPVGHQRRRR